MVIVIPIGYHCSPAAALTDLGIRQEAYPFDWLRSPIKAVSEVISNDFTDFCKKDHLRLSANGTFLVDKYGFEFPHDFPNKQRTPAHLRKLLGEKVLHEDLPEDLVADNWHESL